MSERRRALWYMLPAYEEALNLPPLLADFRDMIAGWPDAPKVHVVVVDDGSGDDTKEAALSVNGLDPVVLVHVPNQGLGVAMRTGIEYVLARAADDDWLVTMDADHTHPPELIPAMVARAEDGADLVIASRFAPGGKTVGLAPFRTAISVVASGVLQLMFPGAKDYTCGYRCYRVGLLRWGARHYGSAFLNQQGFSVMVDLLLKLRRRARRIDEVGLLLRYDRKQGVSKMRVMHTALTTLRLLGRRFVGNPHGPLEPPARDAVEVVEYGADAMGS